MESMTNVPSENTGTDSAATAPDDGDSAFAREASEDLTYGDIVWTQFQRNKMAVASLWALAGLILLAVFAPVIASSQPFIWETSSGRSYPWFGSLFDRLFFENPVDIFFNLILALGLPVSVLAWFRLRSIRAMKLAKRPRRSRMRAEARVAVLGFLGCFLLVLLFPTQNPYVNYRKLQDRMEANGEKVEAVFPPIAYAFRDTGFRNLEGPSRSHVLGIDNSGRDVAVRMLYGIRVSLTIGVVAVGIYVTIGILLGATAGFFGGWVDIGIQRLIEIFMALPVIFVVITLIAFVDRATIFHIMVLIGLVRWTGVARLTRGEFLRLRNQDFVTASLALGFRRRSIIFRHILPNALGPVLVAAAFGVASAILLESTLSFLGLGDISAPSWGQTLREGYSSGKWHLILSPGFAIFFTVSALNLMGEGLRDALDPKLRQ